MNPGYDDFDEFEFDDSLAVRKMLLEMRREELRQAAQRRRGHTPRKRWDDFDDDDEDEDVYGEYDGDDDYDDDEFDSYS